MRSPIGRSVTVANATGRYACCTYRLVPCARFLAILFAPWLLAATSAMGALPEGVIVSNNILDRDTWIDANTINMVVTNHGSFAYDIPQGNSGLEYPKGSLNTAMFSAGLWMGARVDGELRVTVAEYSFEYAPGVILSPNQWSDPDDESYRVYKIAPGDTPESNPDYAEWPAGDGAPLDENGNPRHFGAQTLWSVYNDLNPDVHTNDAGNTAPLGIEVQHTTFAFDHSDAGGHIVFLEWRIINKGGDLLEDAYIGLWSDPDVGGSGDDFAGCVPDLSLGYAYNATNHDLQYGGTPPATGFQLVQGPIVPSPGDVAYVSGATVPDFRNLPMTSFTYYINGTDPSSTSQSYNYMRGFNANGDEFVDPTTGEVTKFMVSGDPITGEGWVDTGPSDRRFMIGAGPFTLAPGETQVVAAAIVMGQGLDRLASVGVMRDHAEVAVDLFRSAMGDGTGACCSQGECYVTTATECLTGDFFLGSSCDPSPCSGAGACCFDNGTCFLTGSEACTGRYQGDGTVCDPNPCQVFGPPSACCLGAFACETLAEYDCIQAGGTYLGGQTCELLPPGDGPGWMRTLDGRIMVDEVAGAGGVPVPPDANGGPGNSVWVSLNSTGDWLMGAGGGNGSESRFTRDGADELNLSASDVILRWDNAIDNVGWWVFDFGEAGRIPFGLYERDPVTGVETRLIPVLFSNAGTAGTYDISEFTPDPLVGWPATDWTYAYRFDPAIASWEEFVEDASDGNIDVDPTTVELFARMILASESSTLPADGTVIQFSTEKTSIFAGSRFNGAVPLAWQAPSDGGACMETPEYHIYRDGVLIGATQRTDFLDRTGLTNDQSYSYSILTRNPNTGEESPPSDPLQATPTLNGFDVVSGLSTSPVVVDGVINDVEWSDATAVDARRVVSDAPSTVFLENDGAFLYIGLRDGLSAADFRIYVDADGNGVFDLPLDGMIALQSGVRRFTRLQGTYPDVVATEETLNPNWMLGAWSATEAEIRLPLFAGPLKHRPAGDVIRLFFHSEAGLASYPQGPAVVLAQVPSLFADVQLADAPPQGPPAISILSPPSVKAGQPVTVAAQVNGAAPIASAVCELRASGSAESRPESATAVTMEETEPGIFSVSLAAESVPPEGIYYRIRVTDTTGRSTDSEEVLLLPAPAIATALAYPNPFRDRAVVAYQVPTMQRVAVAIFDVRGQLVRQLASDTRVGPGLQTLEWDGRDGAGNVASSGVYYYRIRGETFRFDRTITLVR